MNIFRVDFTNEEIDILCKYNVIIKGNERNYIYRENDFIPEYAVPVYYEIYDFSFTGTSWLTLIEEFSEWFIYNKTDSLDLLSLKNRNNKNIFSNVKRPGFSGPLSNGMYIVSNYGVRSWQLIIDMLNHINIKNKGHIIVRFPFHREYTEIGNLIWKKELKIFFKYLRLLGYSKERALTHLEVLLTLSKAYKKHKRKVDSLGFVLDITNPYILTVNSKYELSNMISTIKRFSEFKKEYIPIIENMIDFKNELYYKEKNYSQINTDFLMK